MDNNDELVMKYIEDISRIYPGKILLTKTELAKIRNVSESTLNRELRDGRGVTYKKEGGRILYSVRDIAIWLTRTVKTIE